ncbi:MAG TPA: transcriptional regulator [Gemmatimonadaceae bacterium]|nr:transcriptional regulator [Gemmatimonadaceae bacterium]
MAKSGAASNDRSPRGRDDQLGAKPGALRSVRGQANADGPMALDRLIHERMRLGILSALAVNQRMSFGDLKTLLQTTDGNLSVHARKLEEAEYVLCEKSFEGRVPKTEYTITPAGRRALERYLDHMESLIRAARER